jgi:hypothetical protein
MLIVEVKKEENNAVDNDDAMKVSKSGFCNEKDRNGSEGAVTCDSSRLRTLRITKELHDMVSHHGGQIIIEEDSVDVCVLDHLHARYIHQNWLQLGHAKQKIVLHLQW